MVYNGPVILTNESAVQFMSWENEVFATGLNDTYMFVSLSTCAADRRILWQLNSLSQRTAHPNLSLKTSQVTVAPEINAESVYRLGVFQNTVRGRVFGTKKELLKERWMKQHNEELH